MRNHASMPEAGEGHSYLFYGQRSGDDLLPEFSNFHHKW
jgi:hypothetical protein